MKCHKFGLAECSTIQNRIHTYMEITNKTDNMATWKATQHLSTESNDNKRCAINALGGFDNDDSGGEGSMECMVISWTSGAQANYSLELRVHLFS